MSRVIRQTAPSLVRQLTACSRGGGGGGAGLTQLRVNATATATARQSFILGQKRCFSSTRNWRYSAPIPAVNRGESKLFESADEAVADIKSGSVILSSGFGLC